MAEVNDLNALRAAQAIKEEGSPKTREAEIASLEAEIARLEEAEPTPYEVFMALGYPEKCRQLDYANKHLPRGQESYHSVEEYAEALRPVGESQRLRLDSLKERLRVLKSQK